MNSSISNFKSQHFIIALLALTLVMVASVSAFNGWFYINKPNSDLERAQKSEHGGYDIIVIGSSRANAYAPYFKDNFKVLNLSAGGAQPYEIKRRLEHALRYSNPQKMIIDLGFFSFNHYWPGSKTYSEYFFTTPQTRFDFLHRAKRMVLYSLDYRNLFENLKRIKQQKPSHQNKLLKPSTSPNIKAFHETEHFYMRNGYNPVPYKQYKLDNSIFEEQLSMIIEMGYAHNTELVMITSPVHARLLQILDVMGIWTDLEQWKRQLINVNKQVAEKYSQQPFPIYDAMIFSKSTTIDIKKSTKLYTESSHFTAGIASNILKSIEKTPKQKSREYTIISPKNIEQHLKEQRKKKVIYNANNKTARDAFVKKYKMIKQ